MELEFYIAQGISILTGILAAFMMQLKKVKIILLFQLAVNLLTALTYILLGGLSGGGICLIAIVQTIVMFLYNRKEKKPHWWVLAIFIAAYVACSVIYYKSIMDIFPALSAVCFAMSIAMSTPFMSRVWYVFNPLFWIVYDISTLAYVNLVIHVVVFISTVVALIRVDDIFRLRKKKTESAQASEEEPQENVETLQRSEETQEFEKLLQEIEEIQEN